MKTPCHRFALLAPVFFLGLTYPGFTGEAVHPEREAAISVK